MPNIGDRVFAGRIYYVKGELPMCTITEGTLKGHGRRDGADMSIIVPVDGNPAGGVTVPSDRVGQTREEARATLGVKLAQTVKRLTDEIGSMNESFAKL